MIAYMQKASPRLPRHEGSFDVDPAEWALLPFARPITFLHTWRNSMAMDITVRAEEAAAYSGGAVVIAVPGGEAPLDAGAAAVDAALDGLIGRMREAGEVKGK